MIKNTSLSAQREFLLKGKPVVTLIGDEFSKKEGITLTQQVTDYYNSIGVVVIRQYASGNKKLYVHEVFLKRKLLDSSSNPAHIPATNQGVIPESFNNKGNIAKILQKIIFANFE